MSSGQANNAKLNFDDLNAKMSYAPIPAYGQSKLADLLMSQELARLATKHNWNLLSTAGHPGSARTNIAANGPTMGGRPPLALQILGRILPANSPEQGAEPLLMAATDPTAEQGAYYGPRFNFIGRGIPIDLPKTATNDSAAKLLWAEAERLTGVSTKGITGSGKQ